MSIETEAQSSLASVQVEDELRNRHLGEAVVVRGWSRHGQKLEEL